MTLKPATIPLNQDATITVEATADGPGIAYFVVDVALGPGVTYIACSGDTNCAFIAGGPPHVDFANTAGKPHVGSFIVGELTVRATGAEGSTALEIQQIIAQDHNGHDLTAALTVGNSTVTAVSQTPTPTPSPTPTPTPASTPTPSSSPTPMLTPAELPHTGGGPVPHGSTWPAGAALLAGAIALSAAFLLGRRRNG
jgi:hypothetical protein